MDALVEGVADDAAPPEDADADIPAAVAGVAVEVVAARTATS